MYVPLPVKSDPIRVNLIVHARTIGGFKTGTPSPPHHRLLAQSVVTSDLMTTTNVHNEVDDVEDERGPGSFYIS